MRGVLALALLATQVAGTRELRLSGRVVRQVQAGEAPVERATVTLHRIGRTAGPVDSVMTDARGRYAFTVSAPDTGAMYLATSRYAGIAYFAPPVRANETAGEAEIHVYDTTSRALRIRHVGRHVVVAAPNPQGAREVVEVWELGNDAMFTLVSTPGRPSFVAPLPRGAGNVRSIQGDFAGTGVQFVDGEVRVVAPFAPGIRQLVVTYDLAPGAFPLTVPLSDSTDVVEVLIEEPDGSVSDTALRALGAVPGEGRNFLRFLGNDRPPGTFQVSVPASAGGAGNASWPWLAGLGLASLGAVVWAMRPASTPARPTAVAGMPSERATLEATLAGVEASLASPETRPDERPALVRHRASLREALEGMAGEGPRD